MTNEQIAEHLRSAGWSVTPPDLALVGGYVNSNPNGINLSPIEYTSFVDCFFQPREWTDETKEAWYAWRARRLAEGTTYPEEPWK